MGHRWNRLLVDNHRNLDAFFVFVDDAAFVPFSSSMHVFYRVSVDFTVRLDTNQLINDTPLRKFDLIFSLFLCLLILFVCFIPLVLLEAGWDITQTLSALFKSCLKFCHCLRIGCQRHIELLVNSIFTDDVGGQFDCAIKLTEPYLEVRRAARLKARIKRVCVLFELLPRLLDFIEGLLFETSRNILLLQYFD